MDNFSPIVKQAFSADLVPIDRTTYMFSYIDPQPGSPQLEELLEDYWDSMPKYQGVSFDDLEILRIMFGTFPTYRESGIQSPVSFGGLGSLTRHLGRLTTGIYESLEDNFLHSKSLSMLNPYMPTLSYSWLFQRAMSAKKHSIVPLDFINELLFANFISMQNPLEGSLVFQVRSSHCRIHCLHNTIKACSDFRRLKLQVKMQVQRMHKLIIILLKHYVNLTSNSSSEC